MKINYRDIFKIEEELVYLREQLNGHEDICYYKDDKLKERYKNNIFILNKLITKYERKEDQKKRKFERKVEFFREISKTIGLL